MATFRDKLLTERTTLRNRATSREAEAALLSGTAAAFLLHIASSERALADQIEGYLVEFDRAGINPEIPA